MIIHREGYRTIGSVSLLMLLINLFVIWRIKSGWFILLLIAGSLFTIAFVARFFRDPQRRPDSERESLIAPADGTIIEIVKELVNEFMGRECWRISIFMSAFDVHVNWIPMSGTLRYYRYHPGKNMIAYHPKSSNLNERTTLVIESDKGEMVMIRQIAGLMARRIVTYPKPGEQVIQGEELGFIKFGSRMDLFLPVDTEILVKQGDKSQGNITPIARLRS